MPIPDLQLLQQTAARAAARHRPAGFSAEVQPTGSDAALVTVRYCWYDSPRFQVEAEVILAAEEVAEALRSLGGLKTLPISYLANHEVFFRVVAAGDP